MRRRDDDDGKQMWSCHTLVKKLAFSTEEEDAETAKVPTGTQTNVTKNPLVLIRRDHLPVMSETMAMPSPGRYRQKNSFFINKVWQNVFVISFLRPSSSSCSLFSKKSLRSPIAVIRAIGSVRASDPEDSGAPLFRRQLATPSSMRPNPPI